MAVNAAMDVATRYRLPARARRLADFVTSSTPKARRRTLRGHWDEPIVKANEIAVRDDLDELLACCGMLETLAFASAMAPNLEDGLDRQLRCVLNDHEVRTYYEETYPTVLPQLLRDRLAGALPRTYAVPRPLEHGEQYILRLLDLDRRQTDDESLSMFLSLLDDYRMDGLWLRDVLTALGERRTIAKLLERDANLGPGDKREPLAVAIEGFDAFLVYADELLDLLTCHEDSMAASLAWLNNAYFHGDSAENIRFASKQVRALLRDWAEDGAGPIAAERAEAIRTILKRLRDHEHWLVPARAHGLDRHLATLDLK